MEHIFLKIIPVVNYIVIVWLISTFFLERRKCIPYKVLKIAFLVCGLIVLSGKYEVWIFGLAQILISCIFVDFLFYGKRMEKAILVITEIISISNIGMIIKSVIAMICIIVNLEIAPYIIDTIVSVSIILILAVFRRKLGWKRLWIIGGIGNKYAFFFMLLVILQCFMVTAMGDVIYKEIAMTRKVAFEIIYILSVIFMFIQIGLMIALIISRNVYREKEYLAAKYLEEQKLHYEYLENRERETKKFRHDIKGHLLLVNDLINKKQYEACETYLHEINVRIDRFSNKISVNNGIADAIVNRFYVEAKQKGIDLQVKGHLPNPCYLSGYDICTILSNLLSNAIEAECAAGGETVHVEFRYTDSEIMLVVENDYIQDLEQSDGAFFTTKEDKANHGFGLENVKECIKKNNGQITIDTEKNIFRVLVCV